MKHYTLAEWTDFARGLCRQAEAGAMRAHLDGGCRRCQRRVATVRRVLDLARAGDPAPPGYAVRSAKALFALGRPERRSRWLTLPVTLRFDSAVVSAAAGTRGARAPERHLLYESGRYTLDLLLGGGESAQAVIAGQLLERPGEPLARVPAYLVDGGSVVTCSVTDEMGGFELRGELADAPELWLLVSDDRRIAVSLAPQAAGH